MKNNNLENYPRIIHPQNDEQANSLDCLLGLLYKAWQRQIDQGNEDTPRCKEILKMMNDAEGKLESYMESRSNM